MVLPARIRTIIGMIMSLAGLVAFIAVYWVAIRRTWDATTAPTFSVFFTFVASALTGLIGGIVAAGMNVKLPDPPPPPAPPAPAVPQTVVPRGVGVRSLTALGNVLVWDTAMSALRGLRGVQSRIVLSVIYIAAYLIVGAAACVAWAANHGSDTVPELIKNLASVFIGLAVVIIRGYFSDNN